MKQKKQQIFLIGGGMSFNNKKDYLNYLENKVISYETLKKALRYKNNKTWKENLEKDLNIRDKTISHETQVKKSNVKYEVLNPTFPNKQNADYKEWKTFFESHLTILDPDTIFVGYSLGSAFLVKYFAKDYTNYVKKWNMKHSDNPSRGEGAAGGRGLVNKLILVGVPHSDEKDESMGSFKIDFSLKSIESVVSHETDLVFIYSKDDFVVPIAEMEKYKKELNKATYVLLNDKGHFFDEHFTEILDIIRK